MTDEEIVSMVQGRNNEQENSAHEDEDDEAQSEERFSIDRCIQLATDLNNSRRSSFVG